VWRLHTVAPDFAAARGLGTESWHCAVPYYYTLGAHPEMCTGSAVARCIAGELQTRVWCDHSTTQHRAQLCGAGLGWSTTCLGGLPACLVGPSAVLQPAD
jgi:hypothetical protein